MILILLLLIYRPVRIYGDGDSGWRFQEGTHVITYRVTNKHAISTDCSFRFRVQVHRCGSISEPRNGYKTCYGFTRNMIWGDYCRIDCLNGYELEGNSDVYCQESGQFDPIPTCKAKVCSPLKPPINGKRYDCTSRYRYGSVCYAECEDGFEFVDSWNYYTQCIDTDQWQQPLPSCVDKIAPTFTGCPTSNIVRYAEPRETSATVSLPKIEAKDNSGSETLDNIKMAPADGVFPEGSTEIKYVAKDKSGNEASCSFKVIVEVIKCLIPKFDDENLEAECLDGHGLGYECSLSCNKKRELHGSKTITCLRNAEESVGYWNNLETSSCIDQRCPNLTAPANGALTCNEFSGKQVCSMHCQQGYYFPLSVDFKPQYLCLDNGNWNPNKTTWDCTTDDRPKVFTIPLYFYYNGDCSKAENQNEIKDGFLEAVKQTQIWNESCAGPSNCSISSLTVECGPTNERRKRNTNVVLSNRLKREATQATITIKITIPFSLNGDTLDDARNAHELKLKTLVKAIKSDAQSGAFDDLIPGMVLDKDSVKYGYVDIDCPKGQVADFYLVACRGCPTGMMYDDISATSINGCSYCPKGFYQDEELALNCKACPEGTTTAGTGSQHKSSCRAPCAVGESSSTGLAPCYSCPAGYYQDLEGSRECKACPPETSSFSKSTKRSDCQAYDLVLKEMAHLQSLPIQSTISDFSLISWFKLVLDSDDAAASFRLTYEGVPVSNLGVSKTLNVSILGQQLMNNEVIATNWNHFVVTWNQSVKQLSLYVNGVFRGQSIAEYVRHDFNLLNATLEVSTEKDTELHLQGYTLIEGLLNMSMITKLSSGCNNNNIPSILNLKDLQHHDNSTVYRVIPSVCEVDECFTLPCNGHKCTNKETGFQCQCLNGFTGVTCNIPPDLCKPNPCYHNSTCRNNVKDKSFTCDCSEGYQGKLCDQTIVNGGWGNWTEWSPCTKSCGAGTKQKTRDCNKPAPDSGGKPCVGSEIQQQQCNTQDCPECKESDLLLANGARMRCSRYLSSMECHSECRPGYYRTYPNNPTYKCSDGVWEGGTYSPPCLRAKKPVSFELRAEAQFERVECSDKAAVRQLRDAFEQEVEQKTPCARSQSCETKIKESPCGVGRLKRELGTELYITLKMDAPKEDIDLDAYEQNGTVSEELAEMVQSMQILETSAQVLQNETQSFKVTINGEEHKSTSLKVDGQINCSPGSVSTEGVCVECPPGTFSDGETCIFCNQGYYQDQPGQTICIECPPLHTTQYIGTTEQSLCIEEDISSTRDSNSPSITPKPTHQDNVPVIVGSVVGVVVVVIVIIALGCFLTSRLRKPRFD